MTTNRILDKLGASTAFTITLAGLASSTGGVGRQSDMIDNSALKEMWVRIFVKLTQGTNPTSNKGGYVYLLLGDDNATPHRTDGAGASDAAITIQNAVPIMTMRNDSSAATGEIIMGEALVRIAAPEWGIAIVHDTGVNLDADAGDHWARYMLVGPDIQAAA